MYYLCYNYLNTATNYQPYWGAQHLYWGVGTAPCAPHTTHSYCRTLYKPNTSLSIIKEAITIINFFSQKSPKKTPKEPIWARGPRYGQHCSKE